MVDVAATLAVLKKPAAKAFSSVVREMAQRNTKQADKAYNEAIESMVLDLHTAWKDEPEPDELPTAEDFVRAARDLEIEYEKARDRRKRELLNRAFLGRFDPDVYKAGMSTILWDYVRELEYPEAVFLDALRRDDIADFGEHPQTKLNDVVVGTSRRIRINYDRFESTLAKRLAARGFLRVERDGSRATVFALNNGLIDAVAEFVWGEYEPGDEQSRDGATQ